MRVIASKGSYHLCEYDNGFYTVDKSTRSVGMTLKASANLEEVRRFFDGLKVHGHK